MIEVDAPTVELVRQARAPGTRALRIVGPVHDVVGEELRAAVEEVGERLLPVLGVEDVLLLHRNPRKLHPLALDLLVSRSRLGLELRQLVTGCLPFLPGSDLVFRHRVTSRCAVTWTLVTFVIETAVGARTHRAGL